MTTNEHGASVTERAAVSGMPLYKVLGSTLGDKSFSTYIEARNFRHKHGGKLRAT